MASATSPRNNAALPARRVAHALLALLAAALLALELGLRPLDVWPVLLALYALLLWRKPQSFLFLLPAMLPVTSFAQWTGALYAEEWDLFALLTAVLLYARSAAQGPQRSGRKHSIGLLLVSLLALSYFIAAWRGLLPFSTFDTHDLSGYQTHWNSLRVAKGFFYALLLWPLFNNYLCRGEEKHQRLFALGLATALALISLLCLWERLAFTGLFDMSNDYRPTALFWEMHVGGPALDGFYALTFPFAIWAMLRARALWSGLLAMALFALSSYTIFTTFSRGLYAAYALILGLLLWRQTRGAVRGNWIGLLALLGAVVPLIFVFITSGYRGYAAAAGVLVAAVAASLLWSSLRSGARAQAAGGALAMLGVVGLIALLPKGAYIGYALSFLLSLAAYVAVRRGVLGAQWALAAAAGLPLAALLVARHWGGNEALPDMGLAVLFALALGGLNAARAARPILPDGHSTWMGLAMGLVLAGLAAVGTHSFFVAERFSTVSEDLQGRADHWRIGLSGLQGDADWLLGKGLGRFPATYFWNAPPEKRPGVHRILHLEDNSALMMSSPGHWLGYGELYRVGQNISRDAMPPLRAVLDVRADSVVPFAIEVCQKHLIYSADCYRADVQTQALPNEWQKIDVELKGSMAAEAFYAPRLHFFSLGILASDRSLYVDNVSLRDAQGRELIDNGDFSAGSAHWFFTSDRYHLPWRMHNMWLNYLFDQGWLGLAAFNLMLAGALGRLAFTRARAHSFAPYLFVALAGCSVIGLFDNVVDVPRLAFLFFTLLFTALFLDPSPRTDAAR